MTRTFSPRIRRTWTSRARGKFFSSGFGSPSRITSAAGQDDRPGRRAGDEQFRQAHLAADGQFFRRPFEREARCAQNLQLGKVDGLESLAADASLVAGHLPPLEPDEGRPLDMAGTGRGPEGIDADEVLFQAHRHLDVLHMDARRGQIGPSPGQLQAPRDLRLLPRPADLQVGVEFPAALLDESRKERGEKPLLLDLSRSARPGVDPVRSKGQGKRAGIGSWKLPRACPCSASARAAVPRSASPLHSQDREAERTAAFISPSGLSQLTFPPERAASPFISNRCPGRSVPVARPARRPSRLTARGSQGRKSNKSMPAHSRFHSPSSGDGQPRGLCRGETPL